MVDMYTLSKHLIRRRNKIKGKGKGNKKVNSRNTVEEYSFEHIGLIVIIIRINLSFQNPLTH